MQQEYDNIKKAREMLATIPIRELKEATKTDYVAKTKRLLSKLGSEKSYSALISEALKTTKKSSWQANRAALIFVAAAKLGEFLGTQDKIQRAVKASIAAGGAPDQAAWLTAVATVKVMTKALQAILDAKLPLEGREDRHTKRQDMRGLPEDWRERIIARMPKYCDQALVMAVTGCRPKELVSGIELVIDPETGDLVAWIKGAKVTEKSGQAWRRMHWPANSDSPLVGCLIDLVSKKPPGTRVRVAVNDAKAFSGAMRAAGKRVDDRPELSHLDQ